MKEWKDAASHLAKHPFVPSDNVVFPGPRGHIYSLCFESELVGNDRLPIHVGERSPQGTVCC
jgi:hypothetical protein